MADWFIFQYHDICNKLLFFIQIYVWIVIEIFFLKLEKFKPRRDIFNDTIWIT